MVYNYIEKIRSEQGLSLTQLAKMSGLSVGYICHLEKGSRDNPSMKAMKRICCALKRDLTDVFYI